jgi:hypothetical protein
MRYPLAVLVRDRKLRPRAGVVVDLWFPDETTQHHKTGADGIANFEVPAIAAVTVEVEGNISVHLTRVGGARVEQIAMPYHPRRKRIAHGPFAVMICCPVTGESIDTGVAVRSVTDLASKDFARNSVRCSACNAVHVWSKADAFLGEGDCERPSP